MFRRSIALFLVLVICFSLCAIGASANDYTSTTLSYWDSFFRFTSTISQGTFLEGLVKYIAGKTTDSVCASSPDTYHHTDTLVGSEVHIVAAGTYADATCKYCNETFPVWGADLADAYEDYTTNVQETLGTTQIGKDGIMYLPLYFDDLPSGVFTGNDSKTIADVASSYVSNTGWNYSVSFTLPADQPYYFMCCLSYFYCPQSGTFPIDNNPNIDLAVRDSFVSVSSSKFFMVVVFIHVKLHLISKKGKITIIVMVQSALMCIRQEHILLLHQAMCRFCLMLWMKKVKGDDMRKWKHLTYTDRLLTEKLYNHGASKKAIAAIVGVTLRTIYNELPRGYYDHTIDDDINRWDVVRYSADKARQDYDCKATAKGRPLKLGSDHALANYIEYKIIYEKYSPAAVLATLKERPFSAATLYSYIDKGYFLHLTNTDLPEKSRRHKTYHHVQKAANYPRGTSIEKRPLSIADRKDFGHWEMDCVIGKAKGKGQALC